jgi:hypothetical protein
MTLILAILAILFIVEPSLVLDEVVEPGRESG